MSETDARSWTRRALLQGFGGALALPKTAVAQDGAQAASFTRFVAALEPRALKAGVSARTFAAATAGLQPDDDAPARAAQQPEFETPLWVYLNKAASPARVALGRAAARQWGDVLARVEQRFGVPRDILLAAWGMEANFSKPAQERDVVRALATLAWRRQDTPIFADEFIAALVMRERGFAANRLRGSWAGAMGMPQFMPSAYLRFAVPYSGSGFADIWNSPPDALASIGNFFQKSGWKRGLAWGFEATAPADFAWPTLHESFATWTRWGLRHAGSGPALAQSQASGQATLFAPAGAGGPLFLLSDNYWVIKQYNNSDSYALSLARLGDLIAGAGPFHREWPAHASALSRQERIKLQSLLTRTRFYTGVADGKIGPATRDAVHAFEKSIGFQPADGNPTPAALSALAAHAT